MKENQFEKNSHPTPKQEFSQRETKEKAAKEWLMQRWPEYLEKQEALLKEKPVFSAKGREYPINNELDFLVARIQTRRNLAEKLLEEARETEDYWKEKMAAKLAAFYEQEEKLIFGYAELSLYHPEIAQEVEKESPYLRQVRLTTQAEFQKWQENNE